MSVIKLATSDDIDGVVKLYDEVNDYLSYTVNYNAPTWVKGKYPSRETADIGVAEKSLYIVHDHRDIIGSVILNQHQYDGYEDALWQVNARPEDILVINTLVTSPRNRGQGIGESLVIFAIDYGKRSGMKAIRLSTYRHNTPAKALYKKCGFLSAGELSGSDHGQMLFYSMFGYVYGI